MRTSNSARALRPKPVRRAVDAKQASLFDWEQGCGQAAVSSAPPQCEPQQREKKYGRGSCLKTQSIRGLNRARSGGRTDVGRRVPPHRPAITWACPPESGRQSIEGNMREFEIELSGSRSESADDITLARWRDPTLADVLTRI